MADHSHDLDCLRRQLRETQELLVAERQQALAESALGAQELTDLEGRLERATKRIAALETRLSRREAELDRARHQLASIKTSRVYVMFRVARKAARVARATRRRAGR